MSDRDVCAYAGFIGGVMKSVVVDRPGHINGKVEAVTQMLTAGMTVHRVTLDFARANFDEECEPEPCATSRSAPESFGMNTETGQ